MMGPAGDDVRTLHNGRLVGVAQDLHVVALGSAHPDDNRFAIRPSPNQDTITRANFVYGLLNGPER